MSTWRKRPAAGFTLIEVLVTILVLLIGLIGMMGLQGRATATEMEAYQRGQAMALLRDMESRIRTNRAQFDDAFRASHADPADPSVFGTDSEVACAGATGALREVCQWSEALVGASEQLSDGRSAGAMTGGRGCVLAQPVPADGAVGEFFVVVVWQGYTATRDPAADTPAATCAADVDFGNGLRRAVTLRVLVPKLEG
jgi:type IV pilus assembly protein PilV